MGIEIQDLTENRAGRNIDSADEMQVSQALSLLELVVTDVAKSRIAKWNRPHRAWAKHIANWGY